MRIKIQLIIDMGQDSREAAVLVEEELQAYGEYGNIDYWVNAIENGVIVAHATILDAPRQAVDCMLIDSGGDISCKATDKEFNKLEAYIEENFPESIGEGSAADSAIKLLNEYKGLAQS